jgi:carboxyl-terminal processing protease
MKHRIRMVCSVAVAGLVALGIATWRAATTWAAPRAPLQPDALAERAATVFSRLLPRAHLRHIPLDMGVVTNALHVYLTSLDYDHTYFTASDVKSFEQQARGQDERLARGDVALAFRVFEVFKERVRDRVACVERLLDKGLDVTTRETYRWKRRDAPWPDDAQAWDDLWRRKLTHEYVGLLVARRLAEEARTNATDAAAAPSAGGGATGTVAAVERASDRDRELPPAEFLRKRYQQFLTVMNDSDANLVLQRYLTAFAQAYDPHSDYMTASSSEDFDISMKLSLDGIGALLSSEDGAAKVERIIPGGPADRDGRLKAGDKIIAVAQGDGEAVDVLHWPLYKTVGLIRGKRGTRVVLTVVPASDVTGSVTVKIDLMRDEVKLEDQAARGRVEEVAGEGGRTNRLGVINLAAFYVDIRNRVNGQGKDYRSSTRDVARIIAEMGTNRVEGLLLDLRNNGGGSLAEAVEMTGLFFTLGPVVQVKESRGVQVLSDPDPAVLYAGPLVVLVSRQSASASEILAGALQDYGRAVVVGDSKTHGKGTVQSLLSLDERDPRLGQLKVTVASFHRIVGGSTQLRGVTPDVVIPSVLDMLEVGEEYLPNAMGWTVVGKAGYRAVDDLGPLIETLRARSEKRRATDPRFRAQKVMLERLAERQRSQEITLNLEERLALARSERDLEELQEEALEGGDRGEPPPARRTPDLILEESLRILADLVAVEAGGTDRGHPVLEDARSGE